MNFNGFNFGEPAFVWLLRTEPLWRKPRDGWILRAVDGELRLYTASGAVTS